MGNTKTDKWYKACIKAQAERIKSLEQELRSVKAELNKLKGAR